MAHLKRPAAALVLAAAGIAVAGALSLRYLYLDSDTFRTFCDGAPERWSCTTRASLAYGLRHVAVGWGILALTLVVLAWPSSLRAGLACVATALGLVLFQAELASGAGALLLLHLAIRAQAGHSNAREQQGQASQS